MKKGSITAVIIAKNEAEMIAACIGTLSWCDEIILLNDTSTDQTAEIAEGLGATVITFSSPSFAQLRNAALQHVKTQWVIYIDADERVTPELATEINQHIMNADHHVYSMSRKNLFLGRYLTHGGWGDDIVTRIFELEYLEKWSGDIHESPHYTGNPGMLLHGLLHFSHRDIASGLQKSASWTQIEAELLYKAGIPEVTLFTLIRKGSMEFIRRAILLQGYKDGSAGLVEAVIQAINRVLVYAQVWEKQQLPTIADAYKQAEQEIAHSWKE